MGNSSLRLLDVLYEIELSKCINIVELVNTALALLYNTY